MKNKVGMTERNETGRTERATMPRRAPDRQPGCRAGAIYFSDLRSEGMLCTRERVHVQGTSELPFLHTAAVSDTISRCQLCAVFI